MPTQKQCPVCKSAASIEGLGSHANVSCVRCGEFTFTALANQSLQDLNPQQIAMVLGWIRENQGVKISLTDLPKLYELRMPSVGEKAEKILLHVARNHPTPGDGFVEAEMYQPMMRSVARAVSDAELTYLVQDYLTDEKLFLRPGYTPGRTAPCKMITPKGWAYIDSLRRGNFESVEGFVAMWFDDSMDSAFAAIEQGIRAAGYTAVRIDKKQHNNKIDDEIIASIRRSKFVVADFTKHRGGVYFEAGFAKGLGLEVFWLCREDHFEELHFDTRQYPHIEWQETELPELTKALKDRIEASIGRGPIT